MPRSVIGNILWRVILLPFAALPLIFTGAGVYTMLRQHRAITTYQPAPATVIHSEVHVSHGKSTSYRPDIHYRYDVDNRSYLSKRVAPIQMSTGRDRAQQILSRYPVGATITAYYDPAHPEDAVLVREYVFLPYFFILFSMPFVFIFTFAVGGTILTSWKPKDPISLGRRYQLHPENSLRRHWQVGFAAMGLWYAAGLFALVHYWSTARPADLVFASITFPIYFLLGLIPLKGARRARTLSKRTDTPTVTIDSPTLRPGQSFDVEIEQPIDDPAPERMTITLACTYSTRQNKRAITETLHERIDPLTDPRPRSTYRAKSRLQIPPDGVPSKDHSPTYKWTLCINSDYADGLKYEAKFPVTVTT